MVQQVVMITKIKKYVDQINGTKERLYFVVETKGSNWWDDLRSKKGAKIRCGKKHFEEIATDENPARYIRATNVDDVMGHI